MSIGAELRVCSGGPFIETRKVRGDLVGKPVVRLVNQGEQSMCRQGSISDTVWGDERFEIR